jgi:hypothetical protein
MLGGATGAGVTGGGLGAGAGSGVALGTGSGAALADGAGSAEGCSGGAASGAVSGNAALELGAGPTGGGSWAEATPQTTATEQPSTTR